MADASVLGIHPPSTVRIDLDGWVQDWPFEQVDVQGDRIEIAVETARRPAYAYATIHPGVWSRYEHVKRVAVFYPYEHASEQPDGTWLFHGREDFTITAGPPQPPSLQ